MHDSWNRLVAHSIDGESTVANGGYEYNGLHWRTVKRLPPMSPGAEDEGTSTGDGTMRAMYYLAAWQLVEERIDEDYSSDPGVDRTARQVRGGAVHLRRGDVDGG